MDTDTDPVLLVRRSNLDPSYIRDNAFQGKIKLPTDTMDDREVNPLYAEDM